MNTDQQKDLGHIDVAYIARLARLSLTAEETGLFGGQLQQMLEYVGQMNKVDVAEAEATAHSIPVQNVFREDEPVAGGLVLREIAANAPQWREGLFSVPRIIE